MLKVRKTFSEFTIVESVLFWFCAHLFHLFYISVLRKYVAQQFWEFMSRLEQIPLAARSPQCICPCLLHIEPRMVRRMVFVSILGKCLRTAQTYLQNFYP